MGHVLSVGTVFSTLQATGTLQSPPSSFSSLCFFFLPLPPPRGFRLRAKFRPRANGRAAFFVKREREREIHEVLDFDITAFAASTDCFERRKCEYYLKNRNKLFFQDSILTKGSKKTERREGAVHHGENRRCNGHTVNPGRSITANTRSLSLPSHFQDQPSSRLSLSLFRERRRIKSRLETRERGQALPWLMAAITQRIERAAAPWPT